MVLASFAPSPDKVTTLTSMESFIVIFALAAAAGGALVLLACLAGWRAQLIKAFNLKQQMEERERRMEEDQGKSQAQSLANLTAVSGAATE